MSSGADRPAKKDRQSAAREKARIMREEAQRKTRRRRWIVQGSIGIVILAIIAIVAVVIVQSARPVSEAGPKNMAGNGFILTSPTDFVASPANTSGSKPKPVTVDDSDGKVHITTYVDFQCSYCEQFETTNDDFLTQQLKAGTITLEVHPISILDQLSGTNRYSTRAANAVGCVAQYEPSKFWATVTAFYATENYPPENTGGRTDAQLIATLKGAGVDSSDVTKCVKQETFKGWVGAATDLLQPGYAFPNSTAKVGPNGMSTPTIIIDGTAWAGTNLTDDSFQQAVQAAIAAKAGGAGSTPSPTPTS